MYTNPDRTNSLANLDKLVPPLPPEVMGIFSYWTPEGYQPQMLSDWQLLVLRLLWHRGSSGSNTTITDTPAFLIGDGQNTQVVLTHNLGTKRFAAITLRVLDGDKYLFTNQPSALDENRLEFNFSTPVGTNAIEVILSPIV